MILLTGATGKVGSETAKALAAEGARARALVRNTEKAAELTAAGIEIVVGDVNDAVSVQRALADVERLLVLLPNSERQLELESALVDHAKRAHVRHIVKISSMQAVADGHAAIPRIHWACEEHIRRSGLAWTMIKPNFFMQNLLPSARSIRENRSFTLPFGVTTTAMSDARDIGAVTAEALTGEGHRGRSYEITGPEVLTFVELAERFTQVLGTSIRYVAADPAAYREILKKELPSEWHADAVADLFAEVAAGGLGRTTDTFRGLMGRKPISVDQFIRDHIAAFR